MSDRSSKMPLVDPTDPELREELAKQAYYQERREDAARDREHDLNEEAEYLTLDWDCVSDFARRPYRTAVAVALDAVA